MRRLCQGLALLLIAIGAVGTGVFAAMALYYHRFAAEVERARASDPAAVRAALPTADPGDRSRIILVRAAGSPASGGAVLFRPSPDGATPAFLSIPGSALLAGQPVSRLDTPGLVRGLRADAGIGISHVVIVNPSPRPAGQGALRAIARQVLAPAGVTELQATGRAVAGTSTDLTGADILGLMRSHLDDRHVVECSIAGHQAIESTRGDAVAAAFLAPEGAGRPPMCAVRPVAAASVVPPDALFVLVQDYGTWAFALIAVAALLMSLGSAALVTRGRGGSPAAAPPPPMPPSLAPSGRPGPVLALAGAGGAIRRAVAGAAAEDSPSRVALKRMAAAIAAVRRGDDTELPRYRSRARKFAYLHQDAMWIGLCAIIAAGVLIRLLTS